MKKKIKDGKITTIYIKKENLIFAKKEKINISLIVDDFLNKIRELKEENRNSLFNKKINKEEIKVMINALIFYRVYGQDPTKPKLKIKDN